MSNLPKDQHNEIDRTSTGGEAGEIEASTRKADTAPRATDSTLPTSISIKPLKMHHLPEISNLFREAFGTKAACSCCYLYESAADMTRRYQKYPPEKWALGAVAVDKVTKQVIGHVQMTRKGLPMYPEVFHSCQSDEFYIEVLVVSSTARGKGVGTRLLQWCETKGRADPSIHFLYLSVINGNRAKGLYERFGFRDDPEDDCVDECCDICCTFFLMGRPYGWCNPEWGSTNMKKILG